MEKEKSKAVSFEFIGGKDVMPIGGFYGPFTPEAPGMPEIEKDPTALPDYVSEECFSLIAEAGVNLIPASADQYNKLPERVMKSLDLGEKYGIGIMVNDGNVLKWVGDNTFSAEDVAEAKLLVVSKPVALHSFDPMSSRLFGDVVIVPVGEDDIARQAVNDVHHLKIIVPDHHSLAMLCEKIAGMHQMLVEEIVTREIFLLHALFASGADRKIERNLFHLCR